MTLAGWTPTLLRMSPVWSKQLAKIMKERGLKAKPLSVSAGLNETYVRDIIEGAVPTVGKLMKLADAISVPLSYFFDENVDAILQVPVIGYAAGGEEWTPVDDHAKGGGNDFISMDLSDSDPIAIRVRGHFMSPVFREGDDLICSRMRGMNLADTIGHDCIALTMDGRCYIKNVLKGTQRNTFRLRSYNPTFPDMDNQILEWAAPVVWIRRRQ